MNNQTLTDADFKLFIALWNQRQNMTTPDIHFRLAEWLGYAWAKGDRRLLLMAFRACGKSTLVGLFAAWLLYRNPDLRILVLAADAPLAEKMVRNTRRILEAHPLTAHMKPKAADQWAASRFAVRRDIENRDPSMAAYGITANITGARADVIICDDVEVPNTCDSPDKREQLRQRLTELDYILMDGGTQIYIGTPHSYYSIYARKARTEIGEEKAFLEHYKRFELPILNKNGESVWPERFSQDDIAAMKRNTGPNKFNSQMMLRPTNIVNARLDIRALQVYESEPHYIPHLGWLEIENKPMARAIAYWDPAFGSEKGDGSILAVMYADKDQNFYLQKVVEIKACASDQDQAKAQCETVAQELAGLQIPLLILEANGIGKFLPGTLRKVLYDRKSLTRVQEIHNSQKKETRILEAFDAALSARRLFVHKDVMRGVLTREMQEWRPEKSSGHDDALDAVAGAILHLMRPENAKLPARSFGWMQTGKSHKAESDFRV